MFCYIADTVLCVSVQRERCQDQNYLKFLSSIFNCLTFIYNAVVGIRVFVFLFVTFVNKCVCIGRYYV